MKKTFILGGCLLMAGLLTTPRAAAQINSPQAAGYLERGVAMYRDRNYNGCIDQLLQMRQLHPSKEMAQEAYFYLAMATLHSGDDEALDMLTDFLGLYPESWRTMQVRAAIGDFYFTRALYGKAIDSYLKVDCRALPADIDADTRYRLAYSRMMTGQTDLALSGFEALRSYKPYSNAANFYCGYLQYLGGNYAKARQDFEKVDTSVEPGQAVPYYMSQMDFIAGDYDAALNGALKALASGTIPEFAPELNRIAGESLFHQGKLAQAVPYLEKYVAEESSPRPSALYILGYDQYQLGSYDQAIQYLQRATAANSAVGQSAYLYLGMAYAKEANYNSALMAFDQAIQMDIDPAVSQSARYNYIAARLEGGNAPFVNSVALMEDFLKRYPKGEYAADVRRSLVNGYMSDNDYDSALRIIESAGKNGTALNADMLRARQQALFMLGTRRYSSGDLGDALEYFDNAIDATGGDRAVRTQALLWVANTLSDMDDNKAAIERYRQFLSAAATSNPLYTQGLYNMAYSQLAEEDYAAAYTSFIKVTERPGIGNQLKADALDRAADCMFARQKYKEAATLFAKAYEAYPEGGDYALYRQAEMAGYQRDYNKRIELLDKLMTLYPSSPMMASSLMLKAESAEALGRPADACAIYSQLIADYDMQPLSREASLRMAASKASRDDMTGAVDAYQQLISKHPTSAEARTAMEELKNIYLAQGRLPEYVAFMSGVEGAPEIDSSELEAEAFADAEQRYLNDGNATRLREYIKQFANGANTPKALAYLADEALVDNRYEEAASYAAELLNRYPDSAEAEDALAIQADAQMAMGQLELALESYRRLGQRASKAENRRDAMNGMMLCAIDLGRYDDVLSATEQLLTTTSAGTPEVGKVRFYRALALDRTGHGAEARQMWQPLSDNLTDLYGVKSAVYLAQSELDAGMKDDAAATARRVIDTGSPHTYWLARAFIVYSDVLRAQGKDFEAGEYLKVLRSNYPGQEADIFQMIDQRL